VQPFSQSVLIKEAWSESKRQRAVPRVMTRCWLARLGRRNIEVVDQTLRTPV